MEFDFNKFSHYLRLKMILRNFHFGRRKMKVEDDFAYNWEELYPDPLKVRNQMKPHRVVHDLIDQPRIPDEKCIIVQWTDQDGPHIVRFLKEEYDIPKILSNLREARTEIETKKQDEYSASGFLSPVTVDDALAQFMRLNEPPYNCGSIASRVDISRYVIIYIELHQLKNGGIILPNSVLRTALDIPDSVASIKFNEIQRYINKKVVKIEPVRVTVERVEREDLNEGDSSGEDSFEKDREVSHTVRWYKKTHELHSKTLSEIYAGRKDPERAGQLWKAANFA
jgi:hypothetical protein